MAFTNIIDIIYPVGAVYMSFASTSPATLFGGTWSQVERFLLPQTTASGSTGGTSLHQHAAQLGWRSYYSVMSSMNGLDTGMLWAADWTTNGKNDGHFATQESTTLPVYRNSALTTGSTFVQNAVGCLLDVPTTYTSTMPPYITCYAWHRTA